MKKMLVCLMFSMSMGLIPVKSQAQLYELERLILDIEKLLQLKNILNDLYKGYEILNTGYNTIKDISEGNFNLHKTFLDGLLAISPAVQKYRRVLDIIEDQGRIVAEYKTAYNLFRSDPHFTPEELGYMSEVYHSLIDQTLQNVENLLNIMTAGKLRMSDAERLRAIDALYQNTHERLSFLRQFNQKTAVLAEQRKKMETETHILKSYYGGN